MTDLTWLDRTIGWLSPIRGAQRAQARAVMGAMLSYDGAKRGRRTDGWITVGTSADAEAAPVLALLRDRARDLVRNNPHAAKGKAVIVSNKIGTGIMCQPAGANRRMNARIADRWERWIDDCDLGERLDFYGQQSLSEGTRSESGETLIRFVHTAAKSAKDVPFRIQVLEPDFIDTSRNGVGADGSVLRNGIEYRGAIATGYWLFDAHPGDNSPIPTRSGYMSKRVPASDVIHYFKPLRPGQRRGVTDFAPVILRLRSLDDYDDAEVMRKKIAACLAAWVTTPQGLPGASIGATALGQDGSREESWRPGMVGYLKPGEDVTVADPKPSGDYDQFNSVQLHAIAAGLGMPYELLTGDLSEVTYTSHRGGLVQFRGMVEADQWQLVVPQLCRPIVQRFLEELKRLDDSIDVSTPWSYTPPRFALLDPAKEVPAMIEAIKSGLMTWPETVRREGYDPAKQLKEIADHQKALDDTGVVITSDPRVQQIAKPAPVPTPDAEDQNAKAA